MRRSSVIVAAISGSIGVGVSLMMGQSSVPPSPVPPTHVLIDQQPIQVLLGVPPFEYANSKGELQWTILTLHDLRSRYRSSSFFVDKSKSSSHWIALKRNDNEGIRSWLQVSTGNVWTTLLDKPD